MHDDQIAEARRHVQACLSLWPRGTQTNILAARIERQGGNLPEARRYLTACTRFQGPSEATQLEWLLLRAEEGELDEVEAGLSQCVREGHPATDSILAALVSANLRAWRLRSAKRYLDLWLERDPRAARAWFLQGDLYERLDRRPESATAYQWVVELVPDHVQARLKLVSLALVSHRTKEAVAHVQYLARMEPDNPEVLVALARCQMEAGAEDEAREVLDKVLQRDPGHPAALSLRGQVACDQDHPAEGEVFFRRGLVQSPRDPDLLLQLSVCLKQQSGRQREAHEAWSLCQAVQADSERLMTLLRGPVPLSPRDPNLLAEVGSLLLRLGKDGAALDWLARALRANPNHQRTHQILADYFKEIEPDRAKEHARLGQATPPSFPGKP